MPSHLTRPLAVTTARTVISFFVSVPVLSDAMIVAEPSVSTAAKVPHDRVSPRHALHPNGKDGCHDRGQAFRYRRDRQRHPEDKHVKDRRQPLTCSTIMIVAIITTAITTTMTPSSLPTRASSFCSGVTSCGRLFQHPGDTPHLGLHAGRDDHRVSAPVCRRRAAEDHVVAVAEFGFFRDRQRVLRYRQAFAGERRLRCLQCGRLDQPRIGGNGVAFFDEDDVAGYELSRRDAPLRRRRE